MDQPENQSASSRAYTYVRNQILSGELQPDIMISEGEVATALGMSRTPVREAFQVLAQDDWIRVYPRRGALILRPQAMTVQDYFEFREVLESSALRKIIAQPSVDEVVGKLHNALIEVRAILSGNPVAFREAAGKIHEIIFQAAGNALVVDVLEWLKKRQFRIGVTLFRSDPSPEERRALLSSYEQLVDAIERRDADAACQILRDLLQRAIGLRRQPIP